MSTATLLSSIQKNTFRYGGPVLITVGSVSCLLNIMVFTKGTLRKNPCATCLTGINSVNFICFYLNLLFAMLTIGYNINLTSNSIVICKFQYYIALVLACLESSYIILASIDRTLITSPNAHIRKISTRRLVIISMIIIAIFWLICHIHALILMEILQYGPNYYICYRQQGIYNTIMNYYALVINGVLPPLLMTTFGLWTVKNVHSVRLVHETSRIRNTVTITIGKQHTLQSKDHQLVRMLLVDIFSFVICKCPSSFFLMYQQITKYVEKSAEQQSIEQSLLILTYFLYYIENGISCYTNMFVSKTFRGELKNTLKDIYLRFFN
ncbi:hypothetical protein I4U23_016844 [Adineta vaga]|nr:hypothetical protein I4U23_016844 [Adineta vaga]